jgi:two-component system, NtrC family, sensor kinase
MKILIADDDAVYQKFLRTALGDWGYSCVVVGDGEQAWGVLNSHDAPRLAILDRVMPGADGLEVCRRVRAAGFARYVYIILLTSRWMPADVAAGLEAGADDYLSKPVDPTELRLRLNAACRVLDAEESHLMIAESASDGIVTIGEDGRIQYANPVAREVFGCEPGELQGSRLDLFVPGYRDHHPGGAAESGGAVDNGCRRTFEIAGRDRAGQPLCLEISLSSMPGRPKHFTTAVIRDIAGRRAEEQKRAHARKLESIGQLAAGVAHEINTPIQYAGDNIRFVEQCQTVLFKLLDLYQGLLERSKAGSETAALVEQIEQLLASTNFGYMRQETPAAIADALEGVQRVAAIVRALNEFSHPGCMECAPTDLNHLIDVTTVVSRNRWKDVAAIHRSLDPDLPAVNCASGEIGQVLLNLIVNAADAVAEALHGAEASKGTISISSRRDGAFVEIRVQDSGRGIPEEVRPRIFDPFFTTKDVGKGSGQGLAIAYAIVVQRHGGSLEFETEMGAGSTFVLRLPILSGAAKPNAEPS